MSVALFKHLSAARAAIVAGDMELAHENVERFAATAEQTSPDEDLKTELQAAISDLQALAEASMRGTKAACEQVAEIIQAARTLQTYDDLGQRQVASTVATMPRRY